ncbi:MAG: hypothetical protein OEY96_05425 [Gammaproteobacteria bacterium]|nr:hypothetical protein [Gammaproteobacteria bacterium]
MRQIIVILVLCLLSSCDCDSICQANRETQAFLNDAPSNKEVVDFLGAYIGEAPGAEKYAVFVNWGVLNPDRFVEIMNHPDVTKRIMDITKYKISDMGHSQKYCVIYAHRNETENEKYIRKSLLGCKYGL